MKQLDKMLYSRGFKQTTEAQLRTRSKRKTMTDSDGHESVLGLTYCNAQQSYVDTRAVCMTRS